MTETRKGARQAAATLILGLVLAGCNRPVAASDTPQAWIDAPLNGSTHAVAPIEVVLHSADPKGLALIELTVNGEQLSSQPPEDTSATLATLRVGWSPSAPGEYLLVARAQNHAGAWSPQASAKVILTDRQVPVENGPAIPASATPMATLTQTPEPSITPTPACVDKAGFVADLTIPDNTVFTPGATFTKAWRLRNDGTCPWNEGYRIVFVGGDPMGNPTPVPIPGTVPPGATVDLNLSLTAPTSPGTYRGDYQIRSPEGAQFGVGDSGQNPFYVQIVVRLTPTATLVPTPTATPVVPTRPAPDTQPPSVSVSHSPPEDWIPTGSTITFFANASDNVGVAVIEIWVTAPGQFPTLVKSCNNTTACSFTGGPYNSAGTLTYFAIARDAAGNESNSGGKTITLYVVVSSRPGGEGRN